MIRRFKFLNIYVGEPREIGGGNAFDLDFLVGVDGEQRLSLSTISVKKATSLRRAYSRFYMDLMGHDLEVVFIYKANTNGDQKLIVYSAEANYQTMRGRSGSLLAAV